MISPVFQKYIDISSMDKID